MAWTIRFTRQAEKHLKQLDKAVAQRIVDYMQRRVGILDNPRSLGGPLKGEKLSAYWRYRVGDYRVLARIEDSMVTVFVVEIGHRREVYR